jgi:hypothetical protein
MINQILGTVAVTQQSWRCRNHYCPPSTRNALARSARRRSRKPSPSPDPSNRQRDFSHTEIAAYTRTTDGGSHAPERPTTRFAQSLQQRRFSIAATARDDIRYPSRAKRIASFLCGWHFLRQFLTRDDVACDVCRRSRIRLSHKVRTTSRAMCLVRFDPCGK